MSNNHFYRASHYHYDHRYDFLYHIWYWLYSVRLRTRRRFRQDIYIYGRPSRMQPVQRLPGRAVPGLLLDPGVVAVVPLAMVPADDLRRNKGCGVPVVLPLSWTRVPGLPFYQRSDPLTLHPSEAAASSACVSPSCVRITS